MENDERYTPKYVVDALGPFDLDPCAPLIPLYRTATKMYDKEQNGLRRPWTGRVWCNPPYSSPAMERFIDRMVEHGNGVLLVPCRFGTRVYMDKILPNATSLFFLSGRIRFHDATGVLMGSPSWDSVLFAFGETNDKILRSCGLKGKYVKL